LRLFENRMLRKILGPKSDEVTGEWRKLHNEELYNLYSSPNIICVMKSRRTRCDGHVARMGKTRGAYRGNLRERDHLENPGTDGSIILKWIFNRWDGGVWKELMCLRIGTCALE